MSLEVIEVVQNGNKYLDLTPPDSAHADFSFNEERFRLGKDGILLKCKKKMEEFPNTCSSIVTVLSKIDNPVPDYLHWRMNYIPMVLSFYSTYTPEDGKVHEMVQAQFKYSTLDISNRQCISELKFNSGDCFGMNTTREPRTPQDPPAGPDWMTPVHVVPPGGFPETTPSPTTTPAPAPAPTPGGMGVGGVILILLILALLGGAVFFFLRRQRLLQEEQSLRNAREVGLNWEILRDATLRHTRWKNQQSTFGLNFSLKCFFFWTYISFKNLE